MKRSGLQVEHRVYKSDGKGKLNFVDDGHCLMYVPEVKTNRGTAWKHITFDFGNTVLMLDLRDFKRAAKLLFSKKAKPMRSKSVILQLVK